MKTYTIEYMYDACDLDEVLPENKCRSDYELAMRCALEANGHHVGLIAADPATSSTIGTTRTGGRSHLMLRDESGKNVGGAEFEAFDAQFEEIEAAVLTALGAALEA